MKRNLLIFASAILTTISAKAQVIFYETFDNISSTTSGGAGSYAFPEGWLLRNVDNRVPASQVNYVNEAWERREDFANNILDSCAFSTSWYSLEGAADDWMWTPEIFLPSSTVDSYILSWRAITYDPLFQDGYEVRIMTKPNVPTGETGLIGNQVTNSTLLFSTPAENIAWTNREVNISEYAGDTVRIAFRNNSNDKFLLLIDDVKVERLNFDDPLSVKIISFKGQYLNNMTDLTWKVSGQNNIIQYDVQRSSNGINFTTIGFVSANKLDDYTYQYKDSTPLSGTNYYRLLINEEEDSNYSKTIQIQINKQHHNLSLTPNPTKGILKLESSNLALIGKSCEIFDISGRLVKKIVIKELPMIVDISTLPSSTYLFSIENQDVFKIVLE